MTDDSSAFQNGHVGALRRVDRTPDRIRGLAAFIGPKALFTVAWGIAGIALGIDAHSKLLAEGHIQVILAT